MQGGLHVWRQRFLDGETRELVAECHRRRPRNQDAGSQAFLEALRGISRDGIDEPQLHLLWSDGHSLHHGPRPGTYTRDPG